MTNKNTSLHHHHCTGGGGFSRGGHRGEAVKQIQRSVPAVVGRRVKCFSFVSFVFIRHGISTNFKDEPVTTEPRQEFLLRNLLPVQWVENKIMLLLLLSFHPNQGSENLVLLTSFLFASCKITAHTLTQTHSLKHTHTQTQTCTVQIKDTLTEESRLLCFYLFVSLMSVHSGTPGLCLPNITRRGRLCSAQYCCTDTVV